MVTATDPAFALVLLLAITTAGRAQVATSRPTPDAAQRVEVGTGAHRYAWVDGWGGFAEGSELGSTHGAMLVDAQGRILANTDTERAVIVFAPDGKLAQSWGKELKGGAHGMCLREEGGVEYLYLAHIGRHEVVKTTLDGEVQWTLGWPEAAGIYTREEEFKPTSVAVAQDGRVFVADGYGKSWVHVFDEERKYVKSFGGPGKEPGKMQTPHGMWLDARGKEPLLLVCDRENHRLQWFTLDGVFVREMKDGLKRPCNVAPLKDGGLAVADLVGRVTILDAKDQVVCHLGDVAKPEQQATNRVPRGDWKPGVFFAPHSVCCDGAGDLYVMDWNVTGRITKLEKID